jgi:hemerythrin superfamily protein
MTEKLDMIDVLMHDHQEVEEMFTELETGATQLERRRELTDQVIVELVRHSVAEELYLYPTTREVLPGGDALADREIEEHAAAERTMKELDGMDPANPAFEGLLAQLITDIRGHIADEETDLFPRLRTACGEQDLVELGEKIQRVKKVAPTRPHPAAPDTPPLNQLGGPVLGLVDRVRDALSGRGRD